MANATDTLEKPLAAIADPARRRILSLLKEKGCCSLDKPDGMCACDVESRMELSQPTISHHMKVLIAAGLVQARKHGPWMWYRRNETALRDLLGRMQKEL